MSPTLETVAEVTDFPPSALAQSCEVEKAETFLASGELKATGQHVNKYMPRGKIMSIKIKAVFALAIVAAAFSLAGQGQIFGLSNGKGFTAALVVLTIAVVVAILQLRDNFRTSEEREHLTT